MKCFADATSADPMGAAPYLVQHHQYICQSEKEHKETDHEMTAMPTIAATALNAKATMPPAVKPDGSGATCTF